MAFISPISIFPVEVVRPPSLGKTHQFTPPQRAVRARSVTSACVSLQQPANPQTAIIPTKHEPPPPFPTSWEDDNWDPFSTPELKTLQRQVPIFFHDLKNLRAALLDDPPPPSSEIRPILHRVNIAALRLQAHINRPLPGYREFTEILANLDASYYHPHFLAYLISLNGPIRTLCTNMSLTTTALLRHSQLNIPVDFNVYSPRHIVDTHTAFDRYAGIKIPGLARLCNCYWFCVSWDALRAHRLFKYLPEVGSMHVEDKNSLVMLRQDSDAFVAAYDAIPLHASTVWRLLGFGEAESVDKLGEWLPGEYAGHGHVLAGWRALLGGGGREGAGFEQRFEHLHVPNAMVSYLDAMQEWFKGVGLVSYAPAVRVFEGGLKVEACEGFGVIGCSPVGRVLRRREEDFWGWAERADGCVIGKTEKVYRRRGERARFEVVDARRRLDVVSFVEAQMTMLVQGKEVTWVDVVWYGVLGGMRTFRVRRDEEFLRMAAEFVGDFRRKYAGPAPRPPAAGFQVGELFDRIVERVVLGCENAECMLEVDRVADELRVGQWRQRFTPEKFRRINSRPFLRDFSSEDMYS